MSDIDPEFRDDEEIEIEAIGVEVDRQPIELYKVLKIANVVSGGGEAKYAITEGYVAVNGEIELRKRRKLYDGDLIEFNHEYYVLICDAPVTEKLTEDPVKPTAEKRSPNKTNKKRSVEKAAMPAKKTSAKQDVQPPQETPEPEKKIGGRGAIKFF